MRPRDSLLGESHLSAAVSGSFHRHLAAIDAAIRELVSLSIQVLSPADPRIVAHRGEFLFVASDRVRSLRLVQDRHLECVAAADFLWLVSPDGYVGQSASMEIGCAVHAKIPIFATHAPSDLTLREYVTVVPRLAEAVRRVQASPRIPRPKVVLIDPHVSVEEAHDTLERIKAAMASPSTEAFEVYRDLADLQEKFASLAHIQ